MLILSFMYIIASRVSEAQSRFREHFFYFRKHFGENNLLVRKNIKYSTYFLNYFASIKVFAKIC